MIEIFMCVKAYVGAFVGVCASVSATADKTAIFIKNVTKKILLEHSYDFEMVITIYLSVFKSSYSKCNFAIHSLLIINHVL